MKLSFTLIFLLAISSILTQAQTIERVIINKQDSLNGYYLAIKPASPRISSVLVLVSGYAQPAESIFPETKLHNVAYVNGMLVVAVAIGPKLYADSTVISRLTTVFKDVINRYGVKQDRFVLGGFSAGGTVALRYVELCNEFPAAYPIQPKGVFTVESPVDLISHWAYLEREINRNFSEATVGEARFITNLMTQATGTPQTNLLAYKKLTPFYKDAKEPGNERFLAHTGVRVYHDVDVNWYLKERRRSVLDANYADSSELINRLLILGNPQAEFVQSDRKGYRSNGARHPISWSIVNEVECIQWIKSLSSASYAYSSPPAWRSEVHDFPLDFAPQLTYQGTIDLRFAPGWGQSGSDEFWSYTALWWLDGHPAITPETLQRDLEAYYKGLIKLNVANQSVDLSRIPDPKAQLTKLVSRQKDKAIFGGTIRLYDPFMTHGLIELNVKASVQTCTAGDRTAIVFELSPQPKEKPIWQEMDRIEQQFSCRNTL